MPAQLPNAQFPHQAEFEALCNKYRLQEGNILELQVLFELYKCNYLQTPTSIIDSHPVFDYARMLKQLSLSGGAFSLVVGGNKKDYASQSLVDVLKQSLEDALKEWVRKYDDAPASMGITLDRFRKIEQRVFPYRDNEHPSSDSFTEQELDAIIEWGKGLKAVAKRMKGNVKGYSTPSKNPELGRLVLSLYQYLPEGWSDAKKNAFLADFFCSAGLLDFKGDAWLEAYREKNNAEKDRMVRNWIDSCNKTQ